MQQSEPVRAGRVGETEHQGERAGVHAASGVHGAWRPAARVCTAGTGPGANLRKANPFLPLCPPSCLEAFWFVGFPSAPSVHQPLSVA